MCRIALKIALITSALTLRQVLEKILVGILKQKSISRYQGIMIDSGVARFYTASFQ
ncbi:hypothetical protein GcC1_024034 [Golovinomyces cichoracearum]|uniref:Uncharacterized protein n=1 Tax=Golovinomyces cichoracearum TaxID=62708 RepID=A0A420J457_9PEZI|nr:hypothetical protein GcC1_024034 [Golovinomyces cichoracearum]